MSHLRCPLQKGIWEQKALFSLVKRHIVKALRYCGSGLERAISTGGLAGLMSHSSCPMTNILEQVHSEMTQLFLGHGLVSPWAKDTALGSLRACRKDSSRGQRVCPRVL